MTPEPHSHGPDELCEAGSELYARALRETHVPRADAGQAPCLLGFGLLHPDPDAPDRLRPTPPAVALPRLRAAVQEDIVDELHREIRLAARFEPLMAIARGGRTPDPDPSVTVLNGFPRIQQAVADALGSSSRESLVIQPGGVRLAEALAQSHAHAQGLLTRGGRMRTLYQHTSRHSLPVLAYYERLRGDAEVRTLDEVTERLFIFDRTVAFIPANKDRSMALELRHPALVEYLVTIFERLWRLATPMFPQTAQLPSDNGITTRQHAIAGLLVEGLTDADIADRLGMNIRTARVHIAKLAATLGSNSRAQLGYLIGQSGMLIRDDCA
ncbi:helix-turn-helix transcriptional regulator [Streptomyces atriruber]|uniref:helix-turn-helix transcriptional regulator n=1 Tax=Streptomyces atriruber TaxID=545121 RepID=UPI0006E1EB43|nr:helix-turn-helix transcriptional regulator [Streptomyces atriruber]